MLLSKLAKPAKVNPEKELVKKLKEEGLYEFFEGMSKKHKQEYVSYVAGAVKVSTQMSRIEKVVKMVETKQLKS